MPRARLPYEHSSLSVGEAAAALGVTRLLVVLAMQRGQLQFLEIDGHRLTTAAWLQEWRHAG
jgi:hypothetical protein